MMTLSLVLIKIVGDINLSFAFSLLIVNYLTKTRKIPIQNDTYIHIYLISSSSKEIQDWYVDQFAEIMQTFQEYNSGYFGFFPSFLRPLIFANRDVYGCRSVVPFNL